MFQSLLLVSLLSLGAVNYSFDNYDSLIEIEELRETYSSSYLTSKNTRLSFYYGTPVHYLDDDGHYQPIDTSFKQNKNVFITKANSNIVTLKNSKLNINNNLFLNESLDSYFVEDNQIFCSDLSIYSYSDGLLVNKKVSINNSSSYAYVTSFTILDNPQIKEDKCDIYISNNYKICSPILFESTSGSYSLPTRLDFALNANNLILKYFFDCENIYDSTVNLNQEIMYTNYSGNSYIKHKCFQMNSSLISSSPLLVGSSPLLDPFGNTSEYRIAIGLYNLPSLQSNTTALSSQLYFKKQSGNLNAVKLYRALNVSYDDINGMASFQKTYICDTSLSSNYTSVDLTSNLVNVYNEQGNLPYKNMNIVMLELGVNKQSYIYTNLSTYYPYLTVEYSEYGTTQSFFVPSPYVNCCGYALWLDSGFNFSATFDSQYTTTNHNIAQVMLNVFGIYQNYFDIINVYLIHDYDTIIPLAYRRIAFRIKMNNNHLYDGDYHFMWQTSSGGWAQKIGKETNSSYGESDAINYPSLDSSWGVYNSSTIYFAILTEQQL